MTTMFDQIDELMREVKGEKVMIMLKKKVRKNREIIVELTKQVMAIKEKKSREEERKNKRKRKERG